MRAGVSSRTLAFAVLLSGLILAAYWPAVNGGFVWDDDAHIFQNPTLHDLSGLRDIWLTPGANMQYYPLTFTVFWFGQKLWGLDPTGYHLLNIGMHVSAALLLWRLLERLKVPGAFVGACLFALHPVNVMSVAWVTELKNTLSATVALASCLAYLRFAGVEPPVTETEAPRIAAARWRWYAASLLLFALAMLAKTAVAFLPVTLWLIVWWKQERWSWRDAVPLTPFAILVVSMGAMTIVVERLHGGDIGRSYAMSFAERVIVSGRSFWFYVGKLALPYPLAFLYERFTVDTRQALQYVPFLAMATAGAALFATRGRIGKGPFVAIAHFYVATSAVLIFFVVTYFTRFSFVSDHWQYFGMIGVAALAAAAMARVRRPLAVLVVCLCWILTWRQARIYADVETLWRDTIAKSPGAWMAHNNLGVVLMRRGATTEAIDEYTEALRRRPDLVEAHLNLGNLLAGTGRIESAVKHYNEAMRLDPSSAEAHFDLGRVLADQGKGAEAMAQYEKSLALRPDYADAHNSLGAALHRSGRRSEAIEHFQSAIRAKPYDVDARLNLGLAFLAANRLDEAIAQYDAALRLDPSRAAASNGLGIELAARDRWPEATERFLYAVKVRPDFAEAHNNLGIALVHAKRFVDAIEQFQRALQIRPEFSDARANLERAKEGLRDRQ